MSETRKEMDNTGSKVDEALKHEEVIDNKISEVDTDNETITSSASDTPTAMTTMTTADLSALDYVDFSTPARMLALGEVLVNSKLVPLKTPQDVMTALMTGKDLGLPLMASLSQIYPINGRPTIGVHIQKGLLIKNGIPFEKIEDAVNLYEFVKADKDGKPVFIDKVVNGVNTKIPEVMGYGTIEEQPENTVKRAIDKRTTYQITRAIKMADGKFKTMTAKGSFTLSEAKEADLHEKDVWIKYWRRMLDARAFTNAVGEIADDITLGLRSPNEVSNDYYVNSNGEEVPYVVVD